jgi:hypothetical protein
VKWLRKGIAVALLALWLPATLHCQLETIPGLEFLSCCQHPDGDKGAAQHERDCANDGCAEVESGLYTLEKTQVAPAKSLLELAPVSIAPTETRPPQDHAALPDLSSPPPELDSTWHFLVRAALPVRAPALAS